VVDKDEVPVDRLVRIACLGTPMRSAGCGVSSWRWTRKRTNAYIITVTSNA
jgi:hypothetical protein